MKKILLSLGIILAVAGIISGATIAYYNDTETSTGNIFVAGSIDLKVDHTKQTYNDVDCKTCNVVVVSDTTNDVVAQTGGLDPGPFPHPAVLVSQINPAWTANIPGASWIWWTDPTPEAEEGVETVYTFRRTFNWMGPIDDVELVLAAAADNGYELWLNGTNIGSDPSEQNYNAAGQDVYTDFSDEIIQGENVLEIKVKNMARPAGQTWDNPGGVLYSLRIDGNCGDDFFQNQCKLWGEKDLETGDVFWNFNDIKPSDSGSDVISFHVDDNDAWMCVLVNGTNYENTRTEPEESAGDTTAGETEGELSQMMDMFAWFDLNGNGIYEPSGEVAIYEGSFGPDVDMSIAEPTDSPVPAGTASFIGIKWCAGDQTVDHNTGTITCNGAGMTNQAQTDSFPATVTLYATQSRNNNSFDCDQVNDLIPPVD